MDKMAKKLMGQNSVTLAPGQSAIERAMAADGISAYGIPAGNNIPAVGNRAGARSEDFTSYGGRPHAGSIETPMSQLADGVVPPVNSPLPHGGQQQAFLHENVYGARGAPAGGVPPTGAQREHMQAQMRAGGVVRGQPGAQQGNAPQQVPGQRGPNPN